MNPSEPGKEMTTRRRQFTFAGISLVLGFTVALILTEWALGFYSQRTQVQSMDPGFIRYHPQLGWSLSPGWSGQHKHYDYEASYQIGPDGFRSQPAKDQLEPDSRRIAVIGDSFTFGLGVEDDETFAALLNLGTDELFVNYGVPGTSTDQHLLLLNQILERRYHDEVLLVVYLPNDVLDNTLQYPLQAEQAKPRFLLDGNELILDNVPVPRVAKPARLRSTTMGSIVLNGLENEAGFLERSQLGRLLQSGLGIGSFEMTELQPVLSQNLSPALLLFSALLDASVNVTNEQQSELTLVLLPGRDALLNQDGVSHHFQEYLRQEIITMADSRGVSVIDLMTELATQPRGNLADFYFPNDGHLTPAGHEFVADVLASDLIEQDDGSP